MLVSATPVPLLDEMWQILESNQMIDRYKIRVFDGQIYTLIEDDDFYESCGLRKRINGLLFCWDNLRDYALKYEKEQMFDIDIERTDDEKLVLELKIKEFSREFKNFVRAFV